MKLPKRRCHGRANLHLPNCHTEIQVADPAGSDVAVCPQCRNGYRIDYDDVKEFYRLQPEEPPQRPEEIDTDKV